MAEGRVHGVSVTGPDQAAVRFLCSEDRAVLLAMESSGEQRIPIGCRGGGCGICRVRVTAGRWEAGRMSAAHIPDEDRDAGYALACKVYPLSDLTLEVVGRKPQPTAASSIMATKTR